MSRSKAIHNIEGEKTKKNLAMKNIIIKSNSLKLISEESPEVYKNIDDVVNTIDKLGISRKVAKLKPMIVIIG